MILTSGAFDGLHAGHVQYLEAAKALCEGDELLVCAIATDAYIVQAKGRQPYWHQSDRLRTVTALGCVDAAIPQARQSVADLIREHRPRLFVKGPDWTGRLPEDVMQACDDTGTAIAYVETDETHTSDARPSDEQALAAFEALVQTQTPAVAPWTPVTDYSFEARKAIEGQHPQLIKDVFQPMCVLDVGCGPGHLVRLLRDIGVNARGCDLRKSVLEDAADIDVAYIHGDITTNELQWHFDLFSKDLVICREVLEHLTILEVRRAVANLCRLSTRFVYVTTRFAKAPKHLLSVDTSDDLDPTHITMLSQPFLRTLFVLEGFTRRADLEARMDWQHKGRVLVYERA